MGTPDNRKFPRISHVESRQIIRLDDSQTPKKNLILTENLSASGMKFSTNQHLENGTLFLIYLNDILIDDMAINKNNLLKSGDYYLCQVVRCKALPQNCYEIGAAFFDRQSARSSDMETFTELVNISMLESLPSIY